MADEEHLKILKQGVKVWNEWRGNNHDIQPNLASVELRGMRDLGGVNFRDAHLPFADLMGMGIRWADFRGANLSWTNLTWVQLVGTDLRGADLSGANLSSANLTEADLSEARLRNANLHWTDLSKANMSRAYTQHTQFGSVDLSSVKGLETVVHGGPSSIDIETIYISKGRISEVFLRGAGIPDNFIQYMHSLVGAGFEYYSCFISYSNKDQEFADRIYADLQAKGVRCWFAPEDLKIGDKFRQRIDEAIRFHDKLLVVLSVASVNSSWVEAEVEAAFAREEKEKQLVLFPVRLDDAVMNTDKAWAATLKRMRHIGDFSNWKVHNSYQKGFQRLLRDLQGGTGKGAAAE